MGIVIEELDRETQQRFERLRDIFEPPPLPLASDWWNGVKMISMDFPGRSPVVAVLPLAEPGFGKPSWERLGDGTLRLWFTKETYEMFIKVMWALKEDERGYEEQKQQRHRGR